MVRTKKIGVINDMEAAKAPRSVTFSSPEDNDIDINDAAKNKVEPSLKRKQPDDNSDDNDEETQSSEAPQPRKSARLSEKSVFKSPPKVSTNSDGEGQDTAMSETIEVFAESAKQPTKQSNNDQEVDIAQAKQQQQTESELDKANDVQTNPALSIETSKQTELTQAPFKRKSGRKLIKGPSPRTQPAPRKKPTKKTKPAATARASATTELKPKKKRMIRINASPPPPLPRAEKEESESSYADSTKAASITPRHISTTSEMTNEEVLASHIKEMRKLDAKLAIWRREVRERAPAMYAEINKIADEVDAKDKGGS